MLTVFRVQRSSGSHLRLELSTHPVLDKIIQRKAVLLCYPECYLRFREQKCGLEREIESASEDSE